MTIDEQKETARAALKQARKDLRAAWEQVQHARAVLEGLPRVSPEFTEHQSGCGALWALSNQWSQASSTIKQIAKGLETK